MKKWSVVVSDSYEIPQILSKVAADEWEIILNYVSELLMKHEAISNNMNVVELQAAMDSKYAKNIENLQKQADEYKSNNTMLCAKIIEMQNNTYKDISDKLAEQRDKLCNEYKQERENDRKYMMDTYNNRIAEREAMIKELSAQITNIHNTKQVELSTKSTELREMLEKEYKQNLDNEKRYIANKYESRIESKDDMINELKNNIKEIRNNIENELKEKWELTISKERIMNEQNNTLITNMYKEQEKYMKKQEAQYMDRITELNKSIDEYKVILDNNSVNKESIDKLQSTLNPVIKYYSGNNIEKGNAGEQKVYNILQTRYEDAIIEDTSGHATCSDLYFRWKQLKCLIEVKNKKQLTVEDLDKFKRDIQESIIARGINSGIFVSLETNIYPGRNREVIQIEYQNNIPVVYIYLSAPTDLYYAICCLDKLVSHNTNTNEKNDKLMKHCSDYYTITKSSIEYFEKAIKRNQTEYRLLNKEYNKFQDTLAGLDIDNISGTFVDAGAGAGTCADTGNDNDNSSIGLGAGADNDNISHSDSHNDNDNDSISNKEEKEEKYTLDLSNLENAKSQIKEHIIDRLLRDKSITLADLSKLFNIKPHQFEKLSGYKNLLAQAKQQYMKTIINNDVINKVVTYYATYNKYPPRAYFMKHILSDFALRKINKVIKSKKLLEYIFEYCVNIHNSGCESGSDSESDNDHDDHADNDNVDNDKDHDANDKNT